MGNKPTTSQTFFPECAIREREDAACDESMQFIQQECINNSDDESEKPDKTTVAAPKKKKAKNSKLLEYTDKNHASRTLPSIHPKASPEPTHWISFCIFEGIRNMPFFEVMVIDDDIASNANSDDDNELCFKKRF